MTEPRQHLIIKAFSTDAHFQAFVTGVAGFVARAGGEVYLVKRLHEVQTLEPGSTPAHLWAAHFSTRAQRQQAWDSAKAAGLLAALDDGRAAIALAVAELPPQGLPDPAIPTAANVKPPTGHGPRAYMLIEGSPTDAARVDRYRDIILPMIAERGGYYTLFELGAGVEVWSGQWQESIFAISRWPDVGAAYSFWLSERYQTVAVPARLGAGAFNVLLAEGLAG